MALFNNDRSIMCWSDFEVFAFRCDSNNHMNEFPKFMKDPSNKIMTSHQATPGVTGYVFDGAEGSQMAFWTCKENASSGTHVHEFDEYMLVVQGCYTLIIDESRIPVTAGEEYVIPRGTLHAGEVLAGTRTIHAFGGHRADRELRHPED
jgi:mannose-6-phosphate isomerase-like protein (cupin superfamily)